jgi:Flp pilus assembly protein TadG
MLMPAAVLVLIMLAGIAFDFSHLYLAKRDLASLADAAANNAVTYGVDEASIRRGDGFALDPGLVEQSVAASVAVHSPDLHLIGEPTVELISPTEVRVILVARIDFVFTGAVPGAKDSETVRVTSVADARAN